MTTSSQPIGQIFRTWHLMCLGLFSLLAGCDGCNEGPDEIAFDNPGSNTIGLLIDGANDATGEFRDLTLLASPSNPHELSFDLLPRNDGQEEIAAFTIGRPPYIRNPTVFREGKDIHLIPFADEIVLDVTVWIVDVDAVNTLNNRENEIIDALAYADDIFFTQRMGISIGNIRCVDKTDDPDAKDVRDLGWNHDRWDDLVNDIGFDEGRMNIYLIRKVLDSRKLGYSSLPGEKIALGMYAGSVDLVMHEIGHNLGLDHTGGPNFNSKNIMKGVGNQFTRRKYITEGQIFRAHTMPESVLNYIFDARPGGYTIDCPHDVSSVSCPRIDKRIWADGNTFPAN